MCTLEKRNNLYILTLTGNDEHRLNPTLITSIRTHLTELKSLQSQPDSRPTALITTSQGKYFSNGYDLTWALSDPKTRPKKMSKSLRLLITDLISLPIPTIAAVTGHASAAGFILAMSHDYVIMRKDLGFLYMCEMDIGFKVPDWFFRVLKCRVGEGRVLREIVMKAGRITGEKGLEFGIVDEVGDGVEETVEKAVRVGEGLVGKGWNGRVYMENRMTIMKEVLEGIGKDETVGDDGEDEEEDGAVSRL